MKNDIYKKILIIGLGVLFCLTTIQANAQEEFQEITSKTNDNNTFQSTPQNFQSIGTQQEFDFMDLNYQLEHISPTKPLVTGDSRISFNEYYDGHPTIMCDNEGNLLANYENEQEDNNMDIGMSYSTDGGIFWNNYHWMIPYEEELPDLDYTGQDRTAIGTFVPDPALAQGSAVHFMIYPDIINPNAGGMWKCAGGDLSEHEITHISSADVGGYMEDPKPDPTFKGVWALSADFGSRHTLVLCSYLSSGYRTVVFPDLNGDISDVSVDVDITTSTALIAMNIDHDVSGDGIFIMHTEITNNWSWWEMIEGRFYPGYSNPNIEADNGEIYVAVEVDGEIRCLYSDDPSGVFTPKNIADDGEYPAIVTDGTYTNCLSIMDNNLLVYESEDSQTWNLFSQLNAVDGEVTSDYKSADICSIGAVWADTRNGESDVYYTPMALGQKLLVESTRGGFGVKATIVNTGEEDMESLSWTMSFGDAVFIGNNKSGTISSLPAGESIEIRSGFILGLGSTSLLLTVDEMTTIDHCFVIGPFALMTK